MSLSIPWTSAQLETELGFGASFTSAQLGSAIGAGAYTSAQVAAFNPYTPPSATTDRASISVLFNEGLNNGSKSLTTNNPVTAIVSNGTGPYSYSWFISSGDTSITIISPTSASTYCSATVGVNTQKSCTIECQVTDSTGTKCWTNQVSVSLELDNSF